MDDPLTNPASLNSARPGARVVVRTPQGSAFDGKSGTIAEVVGQTVMVTLDGMSRPLSFGLNELIARSMATRHGHGHA